MTLRATTHVLRLSLALAIALAFSACQREAPTAPAKEPAPKEEAVAVENGAISVAPVTAEPARTGKKNPRNATVDWSPVELASGKGWLSCDLDYSSSGDGTALASLDRESIEAALHDCADRGVMRLRYQGRIAADFAALVERVTRVADALGIRKRVLDLDSAGGQVEDAMRAGDFIAASRWTIWVREDSICHSSCVFLLSAGDVRMIAGKVGIHRIIRMSSTATTRAELNAELRLVHGRVRDYLERNGTSVAVADLMMAVPNRSLRKLTDDELLRFGLDGVNPAQDDLDRLRLQRECGDDFVARRDAFARAFDRQCRESVGELDELNACGLALRRNFGFPDADCPAESPLSEFDLAQEEPEGVDHRVEAAPGEQHGDEARGGQPAQPQSE
jgi:membrane-bound ClpP family serine protease